MKKQMVKVNSLMVMLLCVCIISCDSKNDKVTKTGGGLSIGFTYTVDGNPMQIDTMAYTNGAGNIYEVNEVQWFVSEVYLHNTNGDSIELLGTGAHPWAHYIDSDIQSTHQWNIDSRIQKGNYNALSFVFGIGSDKNKSYMYTDMPEVNMAWPEDLGGGFHYMKLNGFWKGAGQTRYPFNFHLGIGQETKDNKVSFIDNSFRLKLEIGEQLVENERKYTIVLNMEVQEWFRNPTNFDFDVYGGKIMKNQNAMSIACNNGKSGVFSASWSNEKL